jgi:hypothetical protein
MNAAEIKQIAKRIRDSKATHITYSAHDDHGRCIDAAEVCRVDILIRKNGAPGALLATILRNAAEFTFTKG